MFSVEDVILAECSLLDKRCLTVELSLYGKAKMGLHAPHIKGVYEDVWDFPTPQRAMEAIETWNPDMKEPEGWHRHPKTCRYRIGGKKDLEYVRWDDSIEEQIKHAVLVTQQREVEYIEPCDFAYVGSAFPKGTQVFNVTSTHIPETRTTECVHVDLVFNWADRCVVVTMNEFEGGIRLFNIIHRLNGSM